jgi:thioredoxin-related protein
MRFLIVVILIISSISCDLRTPSKIRFAKICDIEIPKDIKVIRDDYQDMWQDYSIIYDIKMTQKECLELTKSIQNSVYYNPKVFVDDIIDSTMYIDANGMKAVWAKTNNGYIFCNKWDRDIFTARVDTTKLIANFTEGHD